jgi:hypothetical protein
MLEYYTMRGLSSLCHGNNSLSSLKDTFLLYKRVTEQYRNPEILKIIRSYVGLEEAKRIIQPLRIRNQKEFKKHY